MAISGVKPKFPIAIALVLAAGMTALLSWADRIPANWVEYAYARHIFPTISHIAGLLADAAPFSWLDLWLAAAVLTLVYSLRRRNWRLPLGLTCAGYLIFFWGWGLNYHRTPIEIRLGLKSVPKPTKTEIQGTTADTASLLNQLWPVVAGSELRPESPEAISRMATERVRAVISRIDHTDWSAASRIKHSYLADWWFRIAGIDGVFNPFPHEPILVGGVPDFQLPFLMAHELAHVHGIADEGDANFVAFLATAESDDPRFRYSAAFEMWLHLGGQTSALTPGPRRDLQTYAARIRSQEIPQVTRLQSAILDSHLKANGVREGVESYSRFVALAIAIRDRWVEFR